jgi:CBS domain-containing protein
MNTMKTNCRMRLDATTAAELMTPNPVSIRDTALVNEAIALLTDKGFSAAPVIDEAGCPVGVLSQTDILLHDREKVNCVPTPNEYFEAANAAWGFHVEDVDKTTVRDMMTPAVFVVPLDADVARVVDEMLRLHVHHMFVVDGGGVLVGVISALDIVRHLRP